ncbi:MAG: helix-turn-helix transcriptional regulator [Gammaproteobacteria bacterium]|nr:helix-turn-helix transcriptional regulator [Gammaproteobacteria bacterium]
MTIKTNQAQLAFASERIIALDDYDRVVGAIHDGALDDDALSTALDQLRDLFKANYVTLILRLPGVEDIGLMLVSGNLEGSGQVTYFTYHQKETLFSNQPVDQVFTVSDVMTDEEWRASSYYQEYIQHQDVYHVMGADISTPESGVLRFRITRPHKTPDFSAEEKYLCTRLLPHLRRSLHVHNLLGRTRSLGSLYAQAINRLSVATLVLDANGSVLQLNDVAHSMLESADGLKMVGGRLEATYPSDNRELHRLIRLAAEVHQGGEMPNRDALSISRPSGDVSLGVVVEPVPVTQWAEGKGEPAVVIYIRDAVGRAQVDNRIAKELFHFTPAETALALELANGLSLEEAAENLGIMRNTARAHLRSIFSKTGVRRQAELVRVMLNSVVALGQSDLSPLESLYPPPPKHLLRPLHAH